MLWSSIARRAAGAAAVVAGATAAAARAQAAEAAEAGGEKAAGTDDGVVEWAWPSPYHAGVGGGRFRQERRFRQVREEWNLAALLAVWTESERERPTLRLRGR